MWSRRKRLTCSESGRKCEFEVVREMVHNSPDGKVFRVRRLVCARCGERAMVAKEQGTAFVPPAWLQDTTVEANF